MTLFVQALLSNVAMASAFAVAAYAATRFLRSPQLAHALWMLVLLKLITPPLVSVPLPAFLHAAGSVWPSRTVAGGASPAALLDEQKPRGEFRAANELMSATGVLAGRESFVTSPWNESPNWMTQHGWRGWLLLGWGAGSLLVAGVGVSRIYRFARLVAATELADDEIQRQTNDLARHLGLHLAPAVRIVRGAIPPLVWSLGFRTEILLPAALLIELGRAELGTILAHELAHIKRRDHWVRWLEALVVVLYWWNPIVWLARRELRQVEEQCCDSWVVWAVPDSRHAYAGAILQTVEFLAAARVAAPVAVSGIGRCFPLKARFAAILAAQQAPRLTWPLRAVVAVLASFGLPLSAVPVAANHAQARQPISSAERVAKRAERDSPVGVALATYGADSLGEQEDESAAAPAAPQEEKEADDARSVAAGRLFAAGFWFRADRLAGKMATASIDPRTGDWKILIENADQFSVAPDGKSIYFSRDGVLWKGDAKKSETPVKVFPETGKVVFAPDGLTLLVTTWSRKADKSDEYETIVRRMGADGAGAVTVDDLASKGNILDWSSDGTWLLADADRSVHLVRPDGKESRLLLKTGERGQFSPDGKRVVHTIPWKGKIGVVELDGSNDRTVVQSNQLIYTHPARWSPNGKSLASVLMDMKLGNDGATPVLFADPNETHPRIAIFDATTGEQRTLTLPQQDGWDFYPTGEIEWR